MKSKCAWEKEHFTCNMAFWMPTSSVLKNAVRKTSASIGKKVFSFPFWTNEIELLVKLQPINRKTRHFRKKRHDSWRGVQLMFLLTHLVNVHLFFFFFNCSFLFVQILLFKILFLFFVFVLLDINKLFTRIHTQRRMDQMFPKIKLFNEISFMNRTIFNANTQLQCW